MVEQNQVTPESLKALQLPDLVAKREAAAEQAAFWKSVVGMVDVEMAERARPALEAAYAAQDKLSGKLTVTAGDGIEFIGEKKKDVKWDSQKLMAIASTMAWPQAQALFKIEFSVPEKTYGGLAGSNPDLKAKIDEARTVDYKLGVKVEKVAA